MIRAILVVFLLLRVVDAGRADAMTFHNVSSAEDPAMKRACNDMWMIAASPLPGSLIWMQAAILPCCVGIAGDAVLDWVKRKVNKKYREERLLDELVQSAQPEIHLSNDQLIEQAFEKQREIVLDVYTNNYKLPAFLLSYSFFKQIGDYSEDEVVTQAVNLVYSQQKDTKRSIEQQHPWVLYARLKAASAYNQDLDPTIVETLLQVITRLTATYPWMPDLLEDESKESKMQANLEWIRSQSRKVVDGAEAEDTPVDQPVGDMTQAVDKQDQPEDPELRRSLQHPGRLLCLGVGYVCRGVIVLFYKFLDLLKFVYNVEETTVKWLSNSRVSVSTLLEKHAKPLMEDLSKHTETFATKVQRALQQAELEDLKEAIARLPNPLPANEKHGGSVIKTHEFA